MTDCQGKFHYSDNYLTKYDRFIIIAIYMLYTNNQIARKEVLNHAQLVAPSDHPYISVDNRIYSDMHKSPRPLI